jgi:hypothetical protein
MTGWIRFRGFALCFVLATLVPSLAHAGGFEYVAPGTRPLGRGGAFMARADDPMALGYNPAALAFLPGYQLMLGSHLGFYDACVDRPGTYDQSGVSDFFQYTSRFGDPDASDPDNWVNQEMPRVCRDGYPGPSPQLVFTGHPLPELGFGIGLLVPSGVGNAVWGNEDGTVEVDGRLLPSPLRYALVRQNLFLVHPTIGVGWSPIPELAVGLSLQWGIATVDFANHSTLSAGQEDPGDDLRTQFQATDIFVPAMILSVHVVPIPQLDIVVSARFSDNINADGTLRATTGYNDTGEELSLTPFETQVNDVNLRAGQPWQFGVAFRYADRRERHRDPDQAGRVSGHIEDAMQNEVWDVELDVVWLHNAPINDYIATLPPDATAAVCEGPNTAEECRTNPSLQAPLPDQLAIPHGWKDQVSIRAGADWNILPGQLAARIGAHFESSAFNLTYHTQDTMPGMRLGLHAGMTFRIARFDISIAYAHIFQFDETITEGNYRLSAGMGDMGQCTEPGGEIYDPNRPVVSRGCYPRGRGAVVNNATYQAEFNIISLDVRYNFQ